MSVLSFPRIYFKGFLEWDPCTFNNNDWAAFPTYDPTNAALNWQFLATQAITPTNPQGITPDNFTTTFRPWAISLLDDTNPQDNPPNGPAGKRVPAEWNMFGSHGVTFVQYNDKTTTITGGDLGYNQPAPANDPLIGGPVIISGDGGNGPGRLVDTNPASPWSSQIYFGQFALGSGAASLSGPRAFRMHSRWLNPNRIYSADQVLTAPASVIGVCFQTCIPFAEVAWPTASGSQLLTNLQQAAEQPGALGIMVRFTGYVNLYFMNGIFNDNWAQPRTYEDLATALATAWDTYNQSGGTDVSKFFSNPCYSHIVGVVGVWNEGELASVPGGRCLGGDEQVAPIGLTAAKSTAAPQPTRIVGHELRSNAIAGVGDPTLLGPAAVNVDYDAKLISLDLSGTMPELGVPGAWPSDLRKVNFGTLSVGVMTNGSFTQIATIDYDQYQKSAYEASAGIIDIPFPDSDPTQLLENGSIAIQVQGQTALLEQVYTAETDTRGIYLDQNGQAEFQIMVCDKGVPDGSANLLLAQYDSGLSLVQSSQTQYIEFLNGSVQTINANGIDTLVTILTTDENGNATAAIGAQNPGFPVIAFFPYSEGDALPQPPANFNFTNDAFFTTVRVLPFDDGVPQEFINLWNSTGDPEQAWNFIYTNILYVYDMLFNVMLKYVNLGDRSAVEANTSAIWSMTSAAAAQESTLAMPITRDMSAGKRKALQLWIYLVVNNYFVLEPGLPIPPDTDQGSNKLALDSIPQGWTPTAPQS